MDGARPIGRGRWFRLGASGAIATGAVLQLLPLVPDAAYLEYRSEFCLRCDAWRRVEQTVVLGQRMGAHSAISGDPDEPVPRRLYERLGWAAGHEHKWGTTHASGSPPAWALLGGMSFRACGGCRNHRSTLVENEDLLLKAACYDPAAVRGIVESPYAGRELRREDLEPAVQSPEAWQKWWAENHFMLGLWPDGKSAFAP